MDIRNTLTRLVKAGVSLTVEEGGLAVESVTPLVEAQRQFLRDHKDELVELLTTAFPMWNITEPDGTCWRSCFAPPQTQEQVLAAYPLGTTATPAEDQRMDDGNRGED